MLVSLKVMLADAAEPVVSVVGSFPAAAQPPVRITALSFPGYVPGAAAERTRASSLNPDWLPESSTATTR
jgi:hypothetical protein